MKKPDLNYGTVFNRLKVLNKSSRIGSNNKSYYNLICECGVTAEVSRSELVTGKTKSCGCLRIDTTSNSFKKLPGVASFRHLYTVYRKAAKTRKITFELSFEQYTVIVAQPCHYCGSLPQDFNVYQNRKRNMFKLEYKQETINNAWIKANGIDRLKSDEGYRVENAVACCAPCNYAKLDYTEQEFIEHCHKISDFQRAKNAK